MNNDILYLQEVILFEDFEKIFFQKSLNKKAGLFEDLQLNSAADWIKNFAKDRLKDSSEVPGGYFTSIISLLAPAVLFRLNPILGVLYLIADAFGYNLSDITIRIANVLKPKLEDNKPISPDEVNAAASSAIGMSISAKESLEYLIKQAGLDDIFEDFYSKKYKPSGSLDVPFLLSDGKLSKIQRVFGNIFSAPGGASKIRWIIGGLASWIIKTLLAGAGLLAVGGLVSSFFGHKRPEVKLNKSPEELENEALSTQNKPDSSFNENKPTSFFKQNTPVRLYPVINGSIKNTIIAWTLDLHQNLNQYKDIDSVLLSSSEFNNVVNKIQSDLSRIGKKHFMLPSEFDSRKEVVDQFIDDILRKIDARTSQ
jgi:hypothetical protein